jgi:hypothetical protein
LARLDITAIIPSCNRPELLAQTLGTLAPHCLRHGIPLWVGENCGCIAGIKTVVDGVRKDFSGLDIHLLDLVPDITEAPSRAKRSRTLDYLYGQVESKYMFHSEDDWRFSEAEFMAPSLVILEQFPDVKLVRLTGGDEKPLADPAECHFFRFEGRKQRFHFSRYGGPGGAYGAFTFHPGLRRRSDYLRYYRPYSAFRTEAAISRHGQSLGHREAILGQCHAWHIGARAEFSTLGHFKER